MKCIFLLAFVGISSFSVDEAKLAADQHEGGLNQAQKEELLESQGRVASKAFASCMLRYPANAVPNFTVVMSLDDQGDVKQTWLRGDSQFAKCVESSFAEEKLFTPPHAPFFTSFEFTYRPQPAHQETI